MKTMLKNKNETNKQVSRAKKRKKKKKEMKTRKPKNLLWQKTDCCQNFYKLFVTFAHLLLYGNDYF